MKEKKKIKMPHVYVLLIGIVFICAILSYIIPAGAYDMITLENGKEILDPNTYHRIEQTPVSLMQFLSAIPRGMQNSASIIFLIFIVGGSFNVLTETGAVESGLGKLAKAASKKEILLIPVVMIAFSLGSAFIGMAEELILFVPIMVGLAKALGFDSITGMVMVMSATSAGFAGAITNPFTVCVAQDIAGVPLFSGSKFRMVVFAVMVGIAIIYTMRYALKVKKNPQISSMYEQDRLEADNSAMDQLKEFGIKQKMILLVFIASLVLLVVGVTQWGWYLDEISALFLGMGIVVAAVEGMGFNNYAKALGKGMADIAAGALVVGFASAVMVTLTDGNIMHTILHAVAGAMEGLPAAVSAACMFLFQTCLNFLIPSGSGQAAVSIPIMAPLGDMVGVSRQAVVLAYQMGDGLSNIIIPTGGIMMAALSLAKIPYEKWARWILPVFLLQVLAGVIIMVVASVIGY
ncbi:SLC13 family permease [Anaerovoracaceae bacterium 42-11]|nr:AbgT family transporter [Emergencia sp.]